MSFVIRNMKYRYVIFFLVLLSGLYTSGIVNAQDESPRKTDVNHKSKNEGFWDNLLNTIYQWHNDEKYAKEHVEMDGIQAIRLETLWKFQIGDNEQWASPNFDDGLWDDIKVPARWENDGYHGYDGYAWYRVHFDGRRLRESESHYLILGFVDDVDVTYLNGTLIGKSGMFPPRFRTAYNSNRKYFLNNELINFDGDNVIAVKVYDELKDGGIVYGSPGIYIAGESLMLLQNFYGPWKFTARNSASYSQIEFNDDNWDELLVPEYWDNQGYKSFDGTAWYRKKFKIDFNYDPNETYYLVLGKIDDFDETYLNGKLIGHTSDRMPINESQSYNAVRIYEIPEGLLDKSRDNVIAIKVEDIGIDGGIYTGPIGITSYTDVHRLR